MVLKFDMIAQGFLVLLVWLSIAAFLTFHIAAVNTPEYQTGYDAGYSEHNSSKYAAAQVLEGSLTSACTDEQLHYACGYVDGYEDFEKDSFYEEHRKKESERLNNSIEILGV